MTTLGRASAVEPLGVSADSLAEEALYQRNAGRVFGFCLSRLRRREDAEDAVQTTFLYAFRSLRRGVVPLVESAWLLGIARNVCLERWEAAGKRNRVETSWDPGELDRAAPAPSDRTEDVLDLEDALTRLPAQQRRAVVLRDWRGLSYEEVAAELGVSHSAVETMIFRGRRTLAQYLSDGAQATRRKLASFANLGWLVSGLKSLFAGGAGAKVAAAVTVVAVSGAGAVGADSVLRGGSEPARPSAPQLDAPAVVPMVAPATQPLAPAPGRIDQRRRAVPTVAKGSTGPTPVSSPPGASAAAGRPAPPVATAVATPAPPPAAGGKPTLPPPVKGPVEQTGPTVKKVVPKAPSPPVLADPVAAVDDVVASTPVAPLVGAVEDTVAPVVGAVQGTAAPVVDPVVETVEDVVSTAPPQPPLPPVPPLLP